MISFNQEIWTFPLIYYVLSIYCITQEPIISQQSTQSDVNNRKAIYKWIWTLFKLCTYILIVFFYNGK